jgi:hypothetical protein
MNEVFWQDVEGLSGAITGDYKYPHLCAEQFAILAAHDILTHLGDAEVEVRIRMKGNEYLVDLFYEGTRLSAEDWCAWGRFPKALYDAVTSQEFVSHTKTSVCGKCETILRNNESYFCKKCNRMLCEECWGESSHEVTPAVMYDCNMEGHPAERDKTICDECYENEAEKASS